MEWREVVNSLPADHFCRGMHPLLEAYCRHAVARRYIDRLIQGLDEREGARQADYNRLLVMQEREGRALASLAVRLGIACASKIQRPISSPTRKLWEKLPR